MEITKVYLFLTVTAIFWFIWRISDWLWFHPKKMEKFLKDQGLKGNPYRFMHGDLKEAEQMTIEAMSKPMKLSHDVTPRVEPFLHKSINTLGKNCYTWMGTNPMVRLSDPGMIREVMVNYKTYSKRLGGNPLVSLIGTGLIDAKGEDWDQRRKIINPAFHSEKLKLMVPGFYASCCEIIEKWEKMLSKDSSCEIDVWPYFRTLSSDAISRTAFGSNFEEGRKIFQLQRELTGHVIKAANSFYFPGSRFLPTKSNKRMKEIDREVKELVMGVINKRVVAMKAGEVSADDLLSTLLDSNFKEIEEHGNSSFGLTMDDIIEECKVFYFAGQETTGNMLVWTMILLAEYPEWQTRAREEILHVFGDEKPDANGLSRLKVMNMIFNEVLRLYPPIGYFRRIIHEETKLGNLTLPAGTFLEVNSLMMHHDKDIWGEDVNEFKPERFAEGISKATKGQTVYLPFGGGPRICIGQNFTVLEGKVVFAMILQRFSFELSPSYSHAPIFMPGLSPQFGAHLILRKI